MDRTPPAERTAIRGVAILPALDIPLSPAPYRVGESTAALRLLVDDPVIGQRQALDVTLRVASGRWVIDRGIAALFTLLVPNRRAPSSRRSPGRRRAALSRRLAGTQQASSLIRRSASRHRSGNSRLGIVRLATVGPRL